MTLVDLERPAQATAIEFPKRNSYDTSDMMDFANRKFGDDLPPLPLPPMLMLHRVIDISDTGGANGLGYAVAEYDVRPDDWYFGCHFKGNPVMPGCLGIDAVQQLAGFALAWFGARGDGMAFGVDGVKFRGKVTPDSGTIQIGIDAKKINMRKISTIQASGWIKLRNKEIYTLDELMVGVVARKT